MAFEASETAPTWVRLVRPGTYYYQGKQIELTAEDLVELARETKRWIADNRALAPLDSATTYYPPLLKEHAKTGERFGSVVDFEVRGEGDELALWGKLRPLTEILWGIEDGRYAYISLRIVWGYMSAEGELYAAIVEEVSLTGTPFFKNIGSLRDYFGISCSDALAQELSLLFTSPQGDDMAMTEQERAALASAQSRAESAENKANALETRLAALERAPKPAVQASEPAPPTQMQPQNLNASDQAPAWFKQYADQQAQVVGEVGQLKTQLTTIAASDPVSLTNGAAPPAPRNDKSKPLQQRIEELAASEKISIDEAVKRSSRLWPDEF